MSHAQQAWEHAIALEHAMVSWDTGTRIRHTIVLPERIAHGLKAEQAFDWRTEVTPRWEHWYADDGPYDHEWARVTNAPGNTPDDATPLVWDDGPIF